MDLRYRRACEGGAFEVDEDVVRVRAIEGASEDREDVFEGHLKRKRAKPSPKVSDSQTERFVETQRRTDGAASEKLEKASR
jgi:hypothetical protein